MYLGAWLICFNESAIASDKQNESQPVEGWALPEVEEQEGSLHL